MASIKNRIARSKASKLRRKKAPRNNWGTYWNLALLKYLK